MQKLCCVRTRQQFSASLDFCHQLTNRYLHQFSTISGGNCIRLTVSSFDSQANQWNQSPIQRELLMPSPEVIDLTLSDDEIQPDPIRSDQRTSTPTRATNRFRTSSSTPPPPPIWHQQNSKNSSSHSRYCCSHRTSWKLSPTPTFLQQHSLWTNTHQLHPQPTQDWHT